MLRTAALACTLAFVSGCVGAPPEAFVIDDTQLQRRALESRLYRGIDEGSLLSACSHVLQDMGFQLEDSEVELGVLTASKDRSAVNAGEVVLNVFIALLGGQPGAMDKDQKIRVSVITKPVYGGKVKSDSAFTVRATFHRVVNRTDGTKRVETLDEKALYEGFFAQLSKSIFIEGLRI